MTRQRITQAQFDALVELGTKSAAGATAREAARLVMVDGQSNLAAATKTGASPQSVSNALRILRKRLALARQAAAADLDA